MQLLFFGDTGTLFCRQKAIIVLPYRGKRKYNQGENNNCLREEQNESDEAGIEICRRAFS